VHSRVHTLVTDIDWHRFVADLLESELAALRRGRSLPAQVGKLDLVADLGADSLELMALAAALAQALQLGQSAMLDALLDDTRVASWAQVATAALAQAPDQAPLALRFRTSGSAGAPKSCQHELATLRQEIAALRPLFADRRRIVSAVPAHHIYGFLFTVLLPQALAVEVVDVRERVAAGLWPVLQPGDLVVGYPDFWQAALAGADEGVGSAALPADVVGVSSTAPCPAPLADGLLAAGLARLVQVYGSSETAGVGWRDSAQSSYRCFTYWRRIDGDDGALERSMPDGTVRAYPLQDSLRWDDDGCFVPTGRRDAAVQVGGVNVFPERVAALLRSHPGVREAAVRLMRPDEGVRLKAFIVPTENENTDKSESSLTVQLDGWLRERLSNAERPASYSFGDALPRQRNGKLADWVIDPG
jgi:long-chain acyl-CoA synthetase